MTFNDTNIRWTDKVHNAVHGCSKSGSPGCANCYAERVSRDFGHTDHPWLEPYVDENVQLKPHFLDDRLAEPAWVFVNSMSDLLHPAVPDAFVADYFDRVCGSLPDSAFQVLTKHGADNDRAIPHPPDNVMLGVSVGHPDWRYRLDWLREQPAVTKFVSFEPLVAPIETVDLSGLDWAIIGGESGPNYRPMDLDWARALIHECWRQDVAVFFKQHADRKTETRQTIEMDGEPRRLEAFPDLPVGVLPKPRKHISPGVTT